MKYISTRGQIEPISFQEAVLTGLADDGGLIIPESIPDFSGRLKFLESLSYEELAFEIMKSFATDIHEHDLLEIIKKSYHKNFDPHVAPLKKVNEYYVMELFHGPTLSFKDVALQFLGNLFEYILAKKGGSLNILGATSGDTGSAGIYGVRGLDRINIFVMHPYKRVSKIQELQMTTVLDKNVHNIAIHGSFDDCQKIMKDIAGDLDFKKKYHIGAINSVNWTRVMAQIVYYFYGYFQAKKKSHHKNVTFCVPTGNFGNILAAWFAKQMGLPIHRLICATNDNDILFRFFQTGEYSLGKVSQTLAPAMDIQVSSNFERYLYYHVGSDHKKLAGLMETFQKTGTIKPVQEQEGADPVFASLKASGENILQTINKYQTKYGYLLDPHTAVAFYVADQLAVEDETVVCVSTAHPAKFPDAIREAVGDDLAHHKAIESLDQLPSRCKELDADASQVKSFIQTTLGD